MTKGNSWIIIILILIFTFFAFNFDYPNYYNRGVDFLNDKLHLGISHFWAKPFRLGLDLKGGVELLYEADLSGVKKQDYSSSMNGLKDVVEMRINSLGVREPDIRILQEGNHYRLSIKLPGVSDPAEAIKEIGKMPYLEFREPKPNYKEIIAKKKELEGKTEDEIKKIKDWQLGLEDPFQPTKLTGRYLEKSQLEFDQSTYEPYISLQFNSEGAKLFEDITARNVKKPLAIYIDNHLISAPVVQEKISGGKAQITGHFTVKEARDLAERLNEGALPVPVHLISQKNVGPTLGAISLNKSLKAGLIGFLAVILFMIIFYRLLGVFASISLSIYIILMLFLFKIIPVTLTLAGIGGFILSIGMAVDANVLIFARVQEEFKKQASFKMALEEGFRRAWPSIRDGNLTTLIVAFILFGVGSSFVKGFATTLSIGIFISMFSAIYITQNLLRCFAPNNLKKSRKLWF